jgi:hypothetical protein
MREGPLRAAAQRQPDDLVGVARDPHDDVRGCRDVRSTHTAPHPGDGDPAVVLPVRREEIEARLATSTPHGGGGGQGGCEERSSQGAHCAPPGEAEAPGELAVASTA